MVKSSRIRAAKILMRASSLSALIVMIALAPGSAHAGPCSLEIDRLQAAADARIDTTAGSGRMGRESAEATEHRQPTPDSIVKAEENLDEGSGYTQALAALARAREADQIGDANSCQQALETARAALGR